MKRLSRAAKNSFLKIRKRFVMADKKKKKKGYVPPAELTKVTNSQLAKKIAQSREEIERALKGE